MLLRRFLILYFVASCAGLTAQVTFSRHTDLLTPREHYSSAAIAVADMNGDGRDDIVRMDQGFRLAVEFQTAANRAFRRLFVGELQQGSQWGICVADIDNNGFPDVLAGGEYDGVKVILANADGSGYSIRTITDPPLFAQTLNLADIDNDGWLDGFVCDDDGPGQFYLNDGAGYLDYTQQPIDLSTEPPSDNSGNYGSVWSDVNGDGRLDLYIAKCRQNVNDPADGRRINQLFLGQGNGVYLQDLTNTAGLRIGAQSWTADFGDIDNDGDFDCFLTNHDVSSQLLENDGAGHFTDITAAAGLDNAITGLPIQGVFRDFDNDGFVDILVAGSVHHLLHNNGDRTFTEWPILDTDPMESFAIGDLNSDGFLDIYAGYADLFSDPSAIPDALWLNNGNANHFFGLNLRGVQSNRSGVGAKAFLYNALGTQVREVRAGESYGIMNSMQLHFGLGQSVQIDSVVVYWPSGAVDRLYHPGSDQYLTLEEGGCAVPQVAITPLGPTTFCSGDSVVITAPGNFTYAWNTGSTAPGITVNTTGFYEVTVTSAAGCTAVSNALEVVVDPEEIPAITASGDTILCSGDTILLTATPGAAYAWSTGATSPSIPVGQSGVYTVTVQGLCGAFTSPPLAVTVIDAPLPAPAPDTVAPNTTATLSASGDQLDWYDAPAGGTLLFTGNPFQTPPLQQTTTFWVANTVEYDLPDQFTGMPAHQGSNFSSAQTNGGLIFDCFTPFRLAKATVYANKAAVRRIVLYDASDNELAGVSVLIPTGVSTIDLNLDIPVGANLKLSTDPVVNLQTLQSNGPQLRRSDLGVAYPYRLPGYLTIKSSTLGTELYFYFYHWQVDFYPYACQSDRVAVDAVVDSSLNAVPGIGPAIEGVRLFPNPATGQAILDWPAFEGGSLTLLLRNTQGMIVRTQAEVRPAGPLQLPVDLRGLPAGIYWLEGQTGRGVVQRKLSVF